MRVLKQLAIALTPFILNAELVKIPEIQEPSILLNAEHPKPVQVQETPLVLNVELPPVEQEIPVAISAPEPAAPVVQEPAAPVVQEPPVVTNNNQCLSPLQVMHVGVRHTESKGVGYKDGYTTLEGFGIYDRNPYFMPFLDLRGHVFNNGQLAGNIGIGERTVIPSINHIFGLYLYYDVRGEEHDLTVNQLSPGIEILGKRMEYRLNAYIPVGNDESHSYHHKFKKFQGNRLLLKQRKKFAMTGADAEIGAHITQTTRHDFYFGIGPYYFTADPSSAWGGKTRLYWRYKDYISLEASYSYDHVFKNSVQGTVAFSYPFGKKLARQGRNCPNNNDLALSRAAFAPYRFEIPVVETRKETKAALNPATNQPWRVWFVRNTSSSDGTYESPFPTLIQAQNASAPNDMIYVFSGDGTTKGMNTGIVLKEGQVLLGSGNSHKIHTTQGCIRIPAFTPMAPTLTSNGNIVTLASGNTVSGMNLLVTQAGSTAIDGTAGVNGVNISHNIISGAVDHIGVSLVGTGKFIVKNNQFTGPNTLASPQAILIRNLETPFTTMWVTDNQIFGYFRGIEVTPLLNPSDSSGFVMIAGNSVSGFNQFGIAYTTGMTDSTAKIMNNTVLNTVGTPASRGIAVILNEKPNSGTVFISGNNVVTTTGAATTGIFAQINTPNASSARFSITNNNVLTGAGALSAGIDIESLATDTICASITGNLVQLQASTGTNGLFLVGTGPINIDDFSNNIIPSIVSTGIVNFVAPGTCQ